jgi:hypothetical protein
VNNPLPRKKIKKIFQKPIDKYQKVWYNINVNKRETSKIKNIWVATNAREE